MKKKPRRYDAGGRVRGPGTQTSDSILARLSNGEYVLPAESVAQVGLPTLESIRRQGLATRALQAGTKGGADLLGVGTGIGGFIKGMTHSPDANAAVQDQLLTDEYRNAQAAIQQGRGQQYPYPPIYGLIGPSPELPVDTVARMQGEQWRADQGGALGTPTHQRKLAEMNQYNPGSMGLPRYAEGGRVGKAEWNRLPRFANGSDPYGMQYGNYGVPVDQDLLNRAKQDPGIMDQFDSALKRNIETRAVESPYYGPGAASNTPNQQTPVAPTAASVPATPGNEWGSLKDKWGIERPRPGTLPEMPGMPGTPANRPPAPSPAIPTGSYQDPRDYSAQNPDASGGAMRASSADQLPGTDIYRRTTAAPGFGPDNPNRIPGPGQIAGTTTYTPLGVSALGGGPGTATFQGLPHPGGFVGMTGTPETRNMTQDQATAYNVANLNRQIEAQQSLREAQNPGITTGQAGRAFGDLVSIGTPGGNFGDEAMRQQKIMGLLSDAGRTGIGVTRRKAILESAQQMAGLPQPPGVTRLPSEQGPYGIDPYKLAQLNMDQQKFGLDQQRFAQEQSNSSYDQALKDQQLKLHAFLQAPDALQKERMDQIQAAYYQVAQAKGPDSPEAKKLATIMQMIHGARPQLDLAALMQQQRP